MNDDEFKEKWEDKHGRDTGKDAMETFREMYDGEAVRESLSDRMRNTLRHVFSLKIDQASVGTIQARILAGAKVTGTNMYILILAILIASIGLNMNSTAVVIGAMLISPIMGAIISMAYAIADEDFYWLKRAGKKFLFQISVSIITSTVYFLISPIDTFSGELAARTNPTLWDVLIALFGGFAAIIANTRKNTSSNVIPGAAIATALMPPLCTTGYCIATGKWLAGAGAFYLFAINSIFICVASVFALLFMGAAGKYREKGKQKHKKAFYVIIAAIIILPSGVMAWQSVVSSDLQEGFSSYVSEEFSFPDTQVVKSELDNTQKQVNVALIGTVLDDGQIKALEEKLDDYGLDGYQLNVTQNRTGHKVTEEDVAELMALLSGENTAQSGETDSSVLQSGGSPFEKKVIEELKILFPEIKSAGFAYMSDGQDGTGDSGKKTDDKGRYTLVVECDSKLSEKSQTRIKKWLKEKFGTEVDLLQAEIHKN